MAKTLTKLSPRPRVIMAEPLAGEAEGEAEGKGKERRVVVAMTLRQAAVLLAEWDDGHQMPVELKAIAAEVGCSPQNLYMVAKLRKYRERKKRVSAVGGSKGRVIRKPLEQDDRRCRDG